MRRGSPQKGDEWQFAYSQDVRCKPRYCHSKILLSLRLKPCELFAAYFGPSQFWFVLSPLSSSPSQSFKASKLQSIRCFDSYLGAFLAAALACVEPWRHRDGLPSRKLLWLNAVCAWFYFVGFLLALDSSSSPLNFERKTTHQSVAVSSTMDIHPNVQLTRFCHWPLHLLLAFSTTRRGREWHRRLHEFTRKTPMSGWRLSFTQMPALRYRMCTVAEASGCLQVLSWTFLLLQAASAMAKA